MGYYSTLNIDTCIKDGCMKEVRGIFAEIKLKMSTNMAEDWECELDWLELADDGWFCCEDWYAKWYHDEKWVRRLSPFLEDGDIEFTGEDGSTWGYRIESGIAYNLIYEKKKGEPVE